MRRPTAPARPAAAGPDDAGFALIGGLLVMTVATILLVTMLAHTLGETRQTGQLRQRVAAVHVAEGQVDTMVARIGRVTGPASNLPCTATVSDARTRPDVVSATTTVTYYTASGQQLSCPPPAASSPTQARVQSVARGQLLDGTAPARRVVEALVRLTAPAYGLSLDKAIYSDTSLTMQNNATINGSAAGGDANIYTTGPFSCANSQTIDGYVRSQSTISMSNSCTVLGDAWSVGAFAANNPSNLVGGKVMVSNAGATLANNVNVTGGVQASGSISWNRCPAPCAPGSSVPAPPVEQFPRLSWDAATQQAWVEAGYTIVTQNTCTGAVNGPSRWVLDQAAGLTGKVLLRTTCAVELDTGGSLRLGQDLAIFADGGIFLGGVNIGSTTSAARNLYLVQPYSARSRPCTDDGVTLSNQVVVDPAVSMLLYSPCVVRKANLSTLTGQIYAGSTVSLDNQLTLNFSALPVYGVTDGSGAGQLWRVDLLAKRENQ